MKINTLDQIKYCFKRDEDFNSLREDTAQGKSGDRKLFPNFWAIQGTLLQSILESCLSRVVGWNFRGKSRFRNLRARHRCTKANAKF